MCPDCQCESGSESGRRQSQRVVSCDLHEVYSRVRPIDKIRSCDLRREIDKNRLKDRIDSMPARKSIILAERP